MHTQTEEAQVPYLAFHICGFCIRGWGRRVKFIAYLKAMTILCQIHIYHCYDTGIRLLSFHLFDTVWLLFFSLPL